MARARFAALALLAALPGCGPFVCRTLPDPERPPTVPASASEAPAGTPSAEAARAPVEGKDHPAKAREWPLASAPKEVVEAVGAERAAFASADELRALYATPLDVDGDGTPEWLVAAEGEFPNVNTPLWVFAERGGRWSNLGFLGTGFAVKKVRGARAGDHATLCAFERDGPDHFAVEFAWNGARFQARARYEPKRGGKRFCERADMLLATCR